MGTRPPASSVVFGGSTGFFDGLAYLSDWGNAMAGTVRVSASDNLADSEALARDWQLIGSDLLSSAALVAEDR